MVPAHKKRDKQNLKNYCPISSLPVAGKIYERILYNNMYEFFTENNLVSPNQSGFKRGDPSKQAQGVIFKKASKYTS